MKIRIFIPLLLGVLLSWTSFACADDGTITIVSPADAKIKRILMQQDAFVYSGDEIATMQKEDGTIIVLKAGSSGRITQVNVTSYQKVHKGDILGTLESTLIVADQPAATVSKKLPPFSELLTNLFKTTG
ncbi:MAG: biotin/lipoyl-binding protein, partial [Desulfopila sp.]